MHTKENIPYCLSQRIIKIVKDSERQKKRLAELHEHLKKQQYPQKLVENGIPRALTNREGCNKRDNRKNIDTENQGMCYRSLQLLPAEQ